MLEYRIYESVYNDMTSGNKNIEVRLLNAKSEKIKIGDKINFRVVNQEKRLIVEVTDKNTYIDFEEFWKDKDVVLSSAKNYTKEECKNALYEIFGKDKVDTSGIVAIKFKILSIN